MRIAPYILDGVLLLGSVVYKTLYTILYTGNNPKVTPRGQWIKFITDKTLVFSNKAVMYTPTSLLGNLIKVFSVNFCKVL